MGSTKGQGYMGGIIAVLMAVIGLILIQQFVTNSLGNFTAGSIERTIVSYIVPIMAVGILVGVAYFGTRK